MPALFINRTGQHLPAEVPAHEHGCHHPLRLQRSSYKRT